MNGRARAGASANSLGGGKLQDMRDNWAGLLNRHATDVAAAAAATGFISDGEGNPRGTGFLVARGVVMTVDFVLDIARRPLGAEMVEKVVPSRLGERAEDCGTSLTIGKTLYDGKADGVHLVLAEVEDHDPILNPPLSVADKLPEPNAIIGRYAFVMGYPHIDLRMPPEFLKHLLDLKGGQKRLMPGRRSAFGNQVPREPPRLRSSPRTSARPAAPDAGPLVDLMTGKVIGMSYAGSWRGERGKFAYAEPIPAAALKLLTQRIQSDAEPGPDQDGQGQPSGR